MGRKGKKKHLKRKPAPKTWPIHRKEAIWTVRPKPGPHSLFHSIPLALILRDYLRFAKTRKEANIIISQEKIKINGKIRKEEGFPIGLMDVIAISDIKKAYRVLPNKKGLFLYPIGFDEAEFRLGRIENKTFVRNGNIQIHLHDGTMMLVRIDDPEKLEENTYQTLNTVKLNIPDRELVEHMKLAVGAFAIIIGGKNIGKYGEITAIEDKATQKRRESLVTIADNKKNLFQTILDFIFVIGNTKSSISLPGVD